MMWFWIFMTVMNLLIPLSMIFLGKIFMKNPPKNINSTFGYRTTMSMKNKDTWDFAHRYFGRLWFFIGIIMLPISILAMLPVLNKDIDTIGWVGAVICFLQIALMASVIIPTETALKKTFDADGSRSDRPAGFM